MLLTLTTTHQPATDLGYLLHKHPAKVQTFKHNFGQSHVFYPETADNRCTAAFLVQLDPLKLTRRKGRGSGFALQPYVNDRPYVTSSFFSVALGDVFRTAMNGVCKSHPELAQTASPLEATVAMVPCRGGAALLGALFEPLGYVVEAERAVRDAQFPEWGNSVYHQLTLRGTVRLADLLSHLYVLLPVLDDDQHYWWRKEEV